MRILFAMAGTHVPELYSGTESNTHHLCRLLQSRGHEVAVLSLLNPKGRIRLANRLRSRLLGQAFPPDRAAGYPVYRGYHTDWERGFDEAFASFRPDVVVYQSWNVPRLAAMCARLAPQRIVVWAHWLPRRPGCDEVDAAACAGLASHAGIRWIANAPFTSDALHALLGIDAPVVRPVFGCARYSGTPRDDARSALFASLNRHKGVDTVLDLADARRDVPFLVVDTWTDDPAQREAAERAVRHRPNVALRRARPDIADAYAATRVLLMPSRGPETWGRMVTEAQCCGIPVLASTMGNLPDTVGPGGICLHPDAPPGEWRAAFDRIWDDEACYGELSAKALEWSRRPEVDETRAVCEFESFLSAAG